MPASIKKKKVQTPLRAMLKKRGMSQKELAEITGYTPQWINAAVNGRASLPIDSMFVVTICEALKIPRDALYGTGTGTGTSRKVG